ncbi:DUF3899 domain-containing protein [Romboutsia lituseburensis]|uniref:DUF3899 domain-containing protein n=1 Tax=Romboutsia lituseburensis TaxID=1537 RepID=UPI00215AC99D|nr:DUF3899 domain-containing protein [Romboutsia lituseburensis]MCR8746092.1 DUF3899 domain-containing protein [Romboutsia lituseburensis]
MKHFLTLLAFDGIISTIYAIFSDFSKYSFLNCAFIIGMIYFLFGLMCFVWEKGFFNITIFAFNKLGQQLQKKRGVLCDDADITIDDFINRENNFFLTYNLLFSGLLISAISIGISFISIS